MYNKYIIFNAKFSLPIKSFSFFIYLCADKPGLISAQMMTVQNVAKSDIAQLIEKKPQKFSTINKCLKLKESYTDS